MISHRIRTTLEQDGTLTLKNLPFHAGETIEVIMLTKRSPSHRGAYPLRGTPVTYTDPFEPVGEGEWDAAR